MRRPAVRRPTVSGRAWFTVIALTGCACARPVTSPTLPAEIATWRATSAVRSFAVARTMPRAATVSADHKLRIINLSTGTEERAIDLGDRAVDVFALAPNGQSVAIGDHAGRVTIWDAGTGQPRCEVHLSHYPGVGVFSHDGGRFATAAQGDPMQIISTATGQPIVTLGAAAGGTNVLAFSRDDKRVATGDGDGVIRVYDAASGQRTSENHEFQMVPLAIDFSADGTAVIAGSGDKTLISVDAATGKTLERQNRTQQPVAYIDVSPDGTEVATAFMKAENMTEPDHIVVRSTNNRAALVDWLPSALPAGGGWTSDGRLVIALASPDALHLWRLR